MSIAVRNFHTACHALARAVLAALATAMLLAAGPVAAQSWGIDQLMQMLANTKAGSATFVERKHISMLDQPLESSGELRYVAPDRLEKLTIKPKREAMRVVGDELSIERGSKKFALQLSEHPELAGFIDSIRGTLAGDRKALERSYKLKLDGSAERWLLSLTPTHPKMIGVIHLIRVSGNHDDVRRIEIIQTDGDRSDMKIRRSTP